MFHLIALLSGLLFGTGMMISGMVDPVNVIGFLDIAGTWNPSLAFVMGGGLLVFMPAYFLFIRRQSKPVCSDEFNHSNQTHIDKPLVVGAILFGLGWGIAGICPGPAITGVGSGDLAIFVFIVTMVVGSVLARFIPWKKC